MRRQCDIKAATDCIVWTLNALAFRRIQAITARESLKTSKSKIMTKFGKQVRGEGGEGWRGDATDAPLRLHALAPL